MTAGVTPVGSIVCKTKSQYRLFYEYAKDRASRIGLAVADNLMGPWEVAPDPFTVRENMWDTWHLSTGPILARAGEFGPNGPNGNVFNAESLAANPPPERTVPKAQRNAASRPGWARAERLSRASDVSIIPEL